MRQINELFIYRKKLVAPYIERFLKLLDAAVYIMSAVFIIALVYEHGYRISFEEQRFIHSIYNWVWGIFIAGSISHIVLDFKGIRTKYNRLTWIINLVLYLTLLPVLFHEPFSTFLAAIWRFFDSHLFRIILLSILSLLQLSSGVVRLLTRRVNPSLILASSFAIFIMIGTVMLMLPRATFDGISFIDALFTSTSAICVTGLTTVDVSTTFTPMGVTFILILIQVGGLGVMTLTSFFAIFFMGNASLYNQVMVSDMVSSKSLNTLLSTLLYILGFTFIIEAVGAVIIFINIHGSLGMTLDKEIMFAIFHSISAFCNAGFSTMSNNLGSELLMRNHNIFYVTITLLIILGGIGFPILVNLYETLKYKLRYIKEQYILRLSRVSRQVHLYDINTRIVLVMTIILLSVGTAAILILEWNKGFSTMPILDKVVHAFFNAACPRTAGFASVPISAFTSQTILILMLLMAIGGGTQSTAGGIKVNVFAVILLNLRAIIRGENKVTVYNRELSFDSIRSSNSTLVLYIAFVFMSLFALTIFEPDIPVMSLLFEAVSALSTVGASLDVTPLLGTDSKVVVVILMFIGRIGVLTMMSSLIKQRKLRNYKYPSGNIIIN